MGLEPQDGEKDNCYWSQIKMNKEKKRKKDKGFKKVFKRLSTNNVAALKKLRGCTTFENKDEMLKEIYKKRKEKRYWESNNCN